jgi:hypothetical protein
MQRAIPRRRAVLALLAVVAAIASAPDIGVNGAAHSARTQYSWCPPAC